MRWLFFLVIILLFELVIYGAARGVLWWAGNLLTGRAARQVMISLFVLSNAVLVFGMARLSSFGLKLSMTWLTLLWFTIMAVLAMAAINGLIMRFLPMLYQSSLYQHMGVRLGALLWLFGFIGMGLYNAYVPTVRYISLTTEQPMPKPLRIAMASDLHLGRLVGHRELQGLKTIVTQQKADVLLMPGDILDDDTHYYDKIHMQPTMQALVSALPLGVYASLGNHDMYGHEAAIRQALQASGVRVLGDEQVNVNEQFWLVSRLDNHARYRQDTAKLMPSLIDKPVILLDHEPTDIDKNVLLPIDLQLSGHTHNGQIFPANVIVKLFNKVSYGHARFNQTNVIVSSGYGFWGVPFRLGSQSEVWIIDLVPVKVPAKSK